MKTACFIPIKANSERVKGKNLRSLNGKPLYQYISEHVLEADVFDDVFIDTNSPEVASYANSIGFQVIERLPELAQNTANGNDLLIYHLQLHPDYDYYFQLFATAPYMQPETIRTCWEKLTSSTDYDSCFPATENHSFYWLAGNPMNYRPGILPRSQDMLPVIEETTGLYGITREALSKYRCRIGRKPYIHIVNKFEAVDINTEEDWKIAEFVGKFFYSFGANNAVYDEGKKGKEEVPFSPLFGKHTKPREFNKNNVVNLRTKIRDRLKRLKNDYGVISIKAEFEAEGSRKDELIMLRELVEPADLGLIIKIGGCEAVHDIDQCKLLDATGIMAPMIETPFALKKFRNAIEKIYGNEPRIEKIINAETISCSNNFDAILEEGKGFLTGVTVGRSDLSASMGISREHIEEEAVFNATRDFCEKSKKAGLITNFGGNIGVESIPFIIKMLPYIDRFETRKVVLKKSDDPEFLTKAIIAALEFELLYLQLKSTYYANMADEDSQRIIRLEKQIGQQKQVSTPPPRLLTIFDNKFKRSLIYTLKQHDELFSVSADAIEVTTNMAEAVAA